MTPIDKARIWWAAARFDFWLDVRCVPGRTRKQLRNELKSNLVDAATDIGTSQALARVGRPRALAGEATRDGQLRSRWLVGVVGALVTLAVTATMFFVASGYYAEGVIDSGVTTPVRSSLFPFFGSNVEVHNNGSSLAVDMEPGILLLVVPLVVLLFLARPWRSMKRTAGAQDAG